MSVLDELQALQTDVSKCRMYISSIWKTPMVFSRCEPHTTHNLNMISTHWHTCLLPMPIARVTLLCLVCFLHVVYARRCVVEVEARATALLDSLTDAPVVPALLCFCAVRQARPNGVLVKTWYSAPSHAASPRVF